MEAGERLGGHVHTIDIAGRRVDVGAEALHLGAPAARELIADLGLSADVVGAASSPSWLWTPGGRRALPAGVGPAGPTRLRPVLSSRVLSARGLVRAGLEPVVARLSPRLTDSSHSDISVGEFVARRFGQEVSDAFVDPLLGGLHSGDIARLSLRACAPGLVAAATTGSSLVLKRKPSQPATPPPAGPAPVLFASFSDGLSRLVEAVAAGLDTRTGASVTRIQRIPAARPRAASTYEVHLGDGTNLAADAVVLAVPGPVAGQLLRDYSRDTATRLERIVLASTATVVLAFAHADVESLPALKGNGILVPSRFGSTLKAATHLSTKWPHLTGGPSYLIRASAGRAGRDDIDRLDDAQLVDAIRADLKRFEGICATPVETHVQRWPTGLPQLKVGHTARLERTRTELAQLLPGVVLAGASYDGVGLTACIASAARAAAEVETLFARTTPA